MKIDHWTGPNAVPYAVEEKTSHHWKGANAIDLAVAKRCKNHSQSEEAAVKFQIIP